MRAQLDELKKPFSGVLPYGPRVLLIHENWRDLSHHCALLRGLGCRVTSSASYEEGLSGLDDGRWNLVIVSQGTVAFEGRRVLERAIEINRRTPVVILTRWHHMPCYLTAMHLGAVDYLEEPVSAADLARVVGTHAPASAGMVDE
jgi:FixJ family two-component response regulator